MSLRWLATLGALVGAGAIGLVVWLAVGLPSASTTSTVGVRPSDASATAALIAERTVERAQRRELQQPVAPSAPLEQPDGVLYLEFRHVAHGVTITLERVEFFPSSTVAHVGVANESDVTAAVHGAALSQILAGVAEVELQSSDLTAEAPAAVAAGTSTELNLRFAPVNGRHAFWVSLDLSNEANDEWSARIEVDPGSIVQNSSTEP